MLKVVLDLVNITGASLRNPRLFEALLFAVRILAAVADTSHAGEPSPGDGFCVLGVVRPVLDDGVRILWWWWWRWTLSFIYYYYYYSVL